MLRTLLTAQTQFELSQLVEKYTAQGWRKSGDEFHSSAAPFGAIERDRFWQMMEKPMDTPKPSGSGSPFENVREAESTE